MEIQHGDGLSPFGPRRPPEGPPPRRSRLLLGVRYGVPLVIFLVGCGVLLIGKDRQTAIEGAFSFFGVAIAVVLLNTFFRIGAVGDVERDREEEAREYFDRHGRWPD